MNAGGMTRWQAMGVVIRRPLEARIVRFRAQRWMMDGCIGRS
jgi:hypothetical protein